MALRVCPWDWVLEDVRDGVLVTEAVCDGVRVFDGDAECEGVAP